MLAVAQEQLKQTRTQKAKEKKIFLISLPHLKTLHIHKDCWALNDTGTLKMSMGWSPYL